MILAKENDIVVTFPSTYWALKFEKMVKEIELPINMIPVPREISSSCGLAAKISLETKMKITNHLEEMEIEEVYQYQNNGWHLC